MFQMLNGPDCSFIKAHLIIFWSVYWMLLEKLNVELQAIKLLLVSIHFHIYTLCESLLHAIGIKCTCIDQVLFLVIIIPLAVNTCLWVYKLAEEVWHMASSSSTGPNMHFFHEISRMRDELHNFLTKLPWAYNFFGNHYIIFLHLQYRFF